MVWRQVGMGAGAPLSWEGRLVGGIPDVDNLSNANGNPSNLLPVPPLPDGRRAWGHVFGAAAEGNL